MITIKKKAIPNMIERIKACGYEYHYLETYRDQAFEITVPNYLVNTYHTFGENLYAINFYDTTDDQSSTINAIMVEYEFDPSGKEFFLNQIKNGAIKASLEKINGKELYLFKNNEDKFCGKLYFANNTFVFYSTPSKEKEIQLRASILSFRWK